MRANDGRLHNSGFLKKKWQKDRQARAIMGLMSCLSTKATPHCTKPVLRVVFGARALRVRCAVRVLITMRLGVKVKCGYSRHLCGVDL